MLRTSLPTTLQHLEARELRDFLRRAIREKNVGEERAIFAAYTRRGIRPADVDYWQMQARKGKT
jgi:hypothetical protein